MQFALQTTENHAIFTKSVVVDLSLLAVHETGEEKIPTGKLQYICDALSSSATEVVSVVDITGQDMNDRHLHHSSVKDA